MWAVAKIKINEVTSFKKSNYFKNWKRYLFIFLK